MRQYDNTDNAFVYDGERRPIVAAQQDGGLVAELLAIDEAAMYERPATTRATIERAAAALAALQRQYDEVVDALRTEREDAERAEAQLAEARKALRQIAGDVDGTWDEKFKAVQSIARAALSAPRGGEHV